MRKGLPPELDKEHSEERLHQGQRPQIEDKLVFQEQ